MAIGPHGKERIRSSDGCGWSSEGVVGDIVWHVWCQLRNGMEPVRTQSERGVRNQKEVQAGWEGSRVSLYPLYTSGVACESKTSITRDSEQRRTTEPCEHGASNAPLWELVRPCTNKNDESGMASLGLSDQSNLKGLAAEEVTCIDPTSFNQTKRHPAEGQAPQ